MTLSGAHHDHYLSQGVTELRPFRPQLFLFRMLAAIFAIEAGLLTYSFIACSQGLPVQMALTERCPRIGQRAENIFEIAIATTLSLLAGGATQKFSSGPSSASSSQGVPPQSPAGPGQPQGPQVPGSGPASGSQEAFQSRQKKKEKGPS